MHIYQDKHADVKLQMQTQHSHATVHTATRVLRSMQTNPQPHQLNTNGTKLATPLLYYSTLQLLKNTATTQEDKRGNNYAWSP